MKRLLPAAAIGLFAGAALAQSGDPALDDILIEDAPPSEVAAPGTPGPSELDELSQAAPDADFPDIETVEKRRPVSVTLRALDKITAKYADLVIAMNEKATFGTLTITARTCDARPPEEFPETTAFVEIVDEAPPPKSNLKIPEPKKKKPAKVKSEAVAAAGEHGGALSPAAPASQAALPANVVFSGWMFESSPALSALQHPVYDVWVIDCKTVKVDS